MAGKISKAIDKKEELSKPDFLEFLNQKTFQVTICGSKGKFVLIEAAAEEIIKELYILLNKKQLP